MTFNSPSSFNEDFANAIGVDLSDTGQDDQQSKMVVDYLVGILGGLDDGHVTHVVCSPSAPASVPPVSDFMAEVLSEIAKHEKAMGLPTFKTPSKSKASIFDISDKENSSFGSDNVCSPMAYDENRKDVIHMVKEPNPVCNHLGRRSRPKFAVCGRVIGRNDEFTYYCTKKFGHLGLCEA